MLRRELLSVSSALIPLTVAGCTSRWDNHQAGVGNNGTVDGNGSEKESIDSSSGNDSDDSVTDQFVVVREDWIIGGAPPGVGGIIENVSGTELSSVTAIVDFNDLEDGSLLDRTEVTTTDLPAGAKREFEADFTGDYPSRFGHDSYEIETRVTE